MEEKNNKAPINFVEIFKKLWPKRSLYYKVLLAVLIGTYLLTLCVPRYYKCEVSLAPELSAGMSMSGSLGSLASSFGLGSLAKMGGNSDALYVEIYPNILKSNDFIAELMTVEVTNKKGDIKTSYYKYLRDHQKSPWWDVVKATIESWFKPTLPPDKYGGKERLDVFNLTEQQNDIFGAAKASIVCMIDKKTDVVTIVFKDQDPLIAATMANATCKKLQDFIVEYRTNKASIDYEYYKKLVDESMAAYSKVRQEYVHFADANQDVSLPSYRAKQEDMENDMQLKYNIYTAMSTQLQAAQAKLQEATPAFTMIQTATVPNKPAGPRRLIISVLMTILAFFGLSVWLLVRGR